jgi:anti-sigma B factor antagonist
MRFPVADTASRGVQLARAPAVGADVSAPACTVTPRPAAFSIAVEPQRETMRLVLAGELDIATADQLRSQLAQLADAGFARIVIDLRAVEFLGSDGLHAILEAHARAQAERWRLALFPGPPAVQRIFEVTNTMELLDFELPNA